MTRSIYGKRGGTSANAGKTVTKYDVALPNGTLQSKATYQVSTPIAWAGVYFHEGAWHVAGICQAPDKVGHGQRAVTAIRA